MSLPSDSDTHRVNLHPQGSRCQDRTSPEIDLEE